MTRHKGDDKFAFTTPDMPSRREKKPEIRDLLPVDSSRRNFLLRCCQSAALIPCASKLGNLSFLFDPTLPVLRESAFHLHPHYRSNLALDAMLAKAKAGSDAFVSEKYHDQLAGILAEWAGELGRSVKRFESLEKILRPDVTSTPWIPVESRTLRADSVLETRLNRFGGSEVLGRGDCLKQIDSYFSKFSKLSTVEFEITGIDVPDLKEPSAGPNRIKTQVRYGFVGEGQGFYRQQHVGYWELEWRALDSGEFQVGRWHLTEETQSRSFAPSFVEITEQTLGQNPSYTEQLQPGIDHWRTVLDGASGIDVYGHNGVSFGDMDNDGFDELYVCQPAGLPNRLFRNRGDGTFEDITETAGVGVLENTACALFADIDNDGYQDLIVVRADGPMLFVNQRNGKFRRQPDAFRFANPPQGTFTGAAMADYDRDGWLDIYFCLYSYYQGTDQYKYPLPYCDAENGPPNFLMRNRRDRTFEDVTARSGLNQNNSRYSFCCSWNDFNQDGWPDLYVVNDFGRKNLYRNNGDGTFMDIAKEAGVEDLGAGMSVCWFDYNHDGAEDLYVADMWTAAGKRISSQARFQENAPPEARAHFRKHAMGNSLFSKTRAGSFRDVTAPSRVGMGRWAWSSDAWDFDHDGNLDLYIMNGMISGPSRDDLNSFFWRQVVANSPLQNTPSHLYEQAWTAINELIRSDSSWSGYERNVFYTNNGDGSFTDASGVLGLDFLEDGRSFALADVDRDGRLEVVLKNRNGPQLRVMKNIIEGLSPSISFRLRGTKSNRDAIGAVVTIETEAGKQARTLQAGSGFLSQHSKELFFGLGQSRGGVRASVRWPGGEMQTFDNLPVNHQVSLEEGSPTPRLVAFQQTKAPRAEQSEMVAPCCLPRQTWLLAPIAAPHFSLPDLDGTTRSLSQLGGKPALLLFWSTESKEWENHLQTLRAASAGLGVIAINVDGPANLDNIRMQARKHSWPFPIVSATEDLSAIYNIVYRQLFDRHVDMELPTAFLINNDSNIVALYRASISAEDVMNDSRNIPSNTAERAARGLPFPGISELTEYRHNYLSYGSLFYQRGYYEQAEQAFRHALEDDTASAEAVYGLGSVYLQEQKSAEARGFFQKVTTMQASYPGTLPNAWNNLGLLSAREDKLDEAVRYFQRALQLSPGHPIALVNLGNAYRQMREWDEARKTLAKAVEVNPEDPEANYSLGMVYAQLNNPDLAYSYLQTALKFRPDYPEALNNLGILYLRTQRREEAIASFERCIRVAPSFDQSYLNLARVYAVDGNSEKARSILRQLLTQHPGHEQAQRALAELEH